MKRILNYIPTVLAAGLIMYLSLMREPHFQLPPMPIPYIDKWMHLLMYMILSAIMAGDILRDKAKPAMALAVAITVSAIYGGAIELLQEYCFPPRTGEWLDWAADTAGAIMGAGMIWLLTYLRKRGQ